MPADGLAGGSATSDPPSGPSGSPNPAPPHPLPHDLTAEDVARIVHGKQTAEYGRLRGYPGFCLDPMPWAEAAACVEDGGVAALGRMGRDPAGVATYWAWKKQLDEAYVSTEAYVKITILGYPSEKAEDGRLAAVDVPSPAGAEPLVKWRANDFPYNFEPCVAHDVVWCTSPLGAAEVGELISARLGSGHDALWFVNPAALASIPGIWHAHVLSRPKPAPGP